MADGFDGLVRRLEAPVRRIRDAQPPAPLGAENDDVQPLPPEQLDKVAVKKTVIEGLEAVGRVRDALLRFLKEKDTQRPVLLSVFGDCTRIAKVHKLVELFQSLIAGSSLAMDKRIGRCLESCKVVEGFLKDKEGCWERQLAKAMEAQQAALLKQFPGARSLDGERVEPGEPGGPATEEPKSTAQLLLELDDATSDELDVARSISDKIFDGLAERNDEFIEGVAYEELIKKLVEHVKTEARQRQERYGRSFIVGDNKLREWVLMCVDPNGDGLITRDEARQGFAKVVNDIE